MLPILIAVMLWLPAMVGMGQPLVLALRRSSGAIVSSAAINTTIAGLLGMFVACTISAAANFFVPIYPVVSTAVLVLGWTMALRHRRRFLRLPGRAWRLVFAIILIASLIDARGIPWYDTGLYHLQAVKWITAQPAPAGLVNLYDRLGVNCGFFPLAAVLETPFALGKSCFIVNALVAVLFALPAMDCAFRRRGSIRPDQIMLVLMMIPLGLFGIDVPMISSLAPDFILMLLPIFCVALWLRSPRFALHIFTLACFAVVIKLSAIPLLASALVITGSWLVRSSPIWASETSAVAQAGRPGIARRIALLAVRSPAFRPGLSNLQSATQKRSESFRAARWIALFLAIAAVVSLGRGIWLSGCVAFPSSVGRISHLNWAAPAELPGQFEQEVRDWSRYRLEPSQVKPGMPWIAGWMKRNAFSEPMLIADGVFLAGLLIWIARRPLFSDVTWRGLGAMIAMIFAIAFWFITAPQVRFGYGYLFAAAGVPMAMGLMRVRGGSRVSLAAEAASPVGVKGLQLSKVARRARQCAVVGGVIALLLVCRVDRQLLRVRLLHWPAIPTARLAYRKTVDGISVAMPVADDRPWNAPIPATPRLDPRLRFDVDASGRPRRFYMK
jgi:hypothetical protein